MIRLTSSLFQLESCHFNNIFIPFISQATKCKVSISNFKLNISLIERNQGYQRTRATRELGLPDLGINYIKYN